MLTTLMVLLCISTFSEIVGSSAPGIPPSAALMRRTCITGATTAAISTILYPFVQPQKLKRITIAMGIVSITTSLAGWLRLAHILPHQSASPSYIQDLQGAASYVLTGRLLASQRNQLAVDTVQERILLCQGSVHSIIVNTCIPITVTKSERNCVTVRARASLLKGSLREEYADENLVLTSLSGNTANPAEMYSIELIDLTHLRTIHHSGSASMTIPEMGSTDADTDIRAYSSGNLQCTGAVTGNNVTITNRSRGPVNIEGPINARRRFLLSQEGSALVRVHNAIHSGDGLKIELTSRSLGPVVTQSLQSDADLTIHLEGTGTDTDLGTCTATGSCTIKQSDGGSLALAAVRSQYIAITHSGTGHVQAQQILCKKKFTMRATKAGSMVISDVIIASPFTIIQRGNCNITYTGRKLNYTFHSC